MQLLAFTDGGSRGNPGDAGIGGVVYNSQEEIIHEFSAYIGLATNNEAEYTAVAALLEWLVASQNEISKVSIYLDSKLVVEQLNRKWKIKEPRLQEFANNCWKLMKQVSFPIELQHVPREKNKHADMLVNRALDAHQL